MSVACSRPKAEASVLEFETRLVEEAVLRALFHRPEAETFHAERDPLYAMKDPEERDTAFRHLHGRWFVQLGLDAPVREVLVEQPIVVERSRGIRIVTAAHRKAEGADLAFPVGPPSDSSAEASSTEIHKPIVVLRLRATTLLDRALVRLFLRRELLHVSDMLDPRFGYAAEMPPSAGGPLQDAVFLERYRVLWQTYVGGRMLRRGWLGEDERDLARARFAATFNMLDRELESQFARWFDSEAHTHQETVEFALNPGGRPQAHLCPLCRFPAGELLRSSANGLGPEGDARAHPGWGPAAGLCRQCADLYAIRHPPSGC